jgi:protein-L-isoaspartate(D-aspartate) O-methyltransferase
MSADFAQLRNELADHLADQLGLDAPLVDAAFRAVPRHLFVPGVAPEEAYRDEVVVTKRDPAGIPVSSSSQPAIMAIMLAQLKLAPGHRVLEIGAGTGYNAALISHIVGPAGQVTAVDIDDDTAAAARAHLAAAGYPDVTAVCADGAAGYPGHAPYDRLIATVGVSDLTPEWLDQLTADAVIVLPLDVRGAQLSVAFSRAPDGHWASRSVRPCGFMRMRGARAGTDCIIQLTDGLRLMVPEERPLDPAALATALTGPPAVTMPVQVTASAPLVLWGLHLWLATREPRTTDLAEEHRPDRPPLLHQTLYSSKKLNVTYGIADGGSIALVTQDGERLEIAGYGPDGESLAADLTAHVRAWEAAGQPGTSSLHIDAYPRPTAVETNPATFFIDRPATRFALYRA